MIIKFLDVKIPQFLAKNRIFRIQKVKILSNLLGSSAGSLQALRHAFNLQKLPKIVVRKFEKVNARDFQTLPLPWTTPILGRDANA